MDVRDEIEIDRLGLNYYSIIENNIYSIEKLQRCREEREKIIREKELEKTLSTKIIDSSKNQFLFD